MRNNSTFENRNAIAEIDLTLFLARNVRAWYRYIAMTSLSAEMQRASLICGYCLATTVMTVTEAHASCEHELPKVVTRQQ